LKTLERRYRLSCDVSASSAFIVERYSPYLNPDVSLTGCHLIQMYYFPAVRDCVLLAKNTLLANLLINGFNSVFCTKNQNAITFRKIDYWNDLGLCVANCQDCRGDDDYFDDLETLLIERNFNTPEFVQYLRL
jgi:hypothetical protein